jgi:RimJ/RimL family protein N-acetyltransferase
MTDGAFTELRSDRLRLRRLQASDLADLCAYRRLPEVARYQSWQTFTAEDGVQLLQHQTHVQPDQPGTWLQLAIVRADTAALVGDCGLHCRADDPRQTELGITLAPAHQGRGFATEALSCVLDHLFGQLHKHRVTATTDADNRPAAELFTRLGFRREGHSIQNVWFKGRWGDEYHFALLRSEWEQRRAASASGRGALLT